MEWISPKIYQTSRGSLEYAIDGRGLPVLVFHSTAGGFDQGLVIGRLFEGVKILSISRPGYLGTPLDTGRSPAELADACVELVDHLDIEKIGVLGLSAGAMGAVQFAIRHPQRCLGLALGSPVLETLPRNSLRLVESAAKMPDAFVWALTQFIIKVALPLAFRDAQVRTLAAGFFEVHPLSKRRAGILNDGVQMRLIEPPKYEKLQIPTLIIHGTADPLIPVATIRKAARAIAGVQYLEIPEGGHACPLTHPHLTRTVLKDWTDRLANKL